MIRESGSCPATSKEGVERDAMQEKGRGATWGWWARGRMEMWWLSKTFFGVSHNLSG